MPIRSVAIIAHVDHGKTTLVDQILRQSGTLQNLEQDLLMDHNDQERERGITIYAKNTSLNYKDGIINIVDTPWHADFGSEVERVLRMVDSVLLVVDAYEGPMPQTKFVLKKALELGLKPVVVINKVDKPTARPRQVIDMLFDLFITLGATDEQAEFPIVYASAKNGRGFATLEEVESFLSDPSSATPTMDPIFETIISHVPPAPDYSDKPFRMQITNLGYNEYVGRLGIGRVQEGKVKVGQSVVVIDTKGATRNGKITKIYRTIGLSKIEISEWVSGDIITIAGIADIFVGDTVGETGIEALPPIVVDEPTLTMDFLVNDSPFAGRDGKLVTSRNIVERLQKELETNVGLQVDFSGTTRFPVSGRGELHLGVLIEMMRREGFELQISAPQVIMKKESWRLMEPIEHVVIHVADDLSGTIIQMLSDRKGMMKNMQSDNGLTSLEFDVPTRGLLGLRSAFILMTKGEGIMYSSFSHYDDHKGDIPKRNNGSLISMENGTAMKYSIWKLQERGTIFVDPGDQIYAGQIVGESAKPGDLEVNLTKNKQQTNVRNSGNDEAMRLEPIFHMELEQALAYIASDEYVEVTPNHIRLRKIHLTSSARTLAKKQG